MDSSLVTAVIYSVIPSVVALIGTVVATFWRPNPTVRGGLLHLAAGVIFAVVAVELLPSIMRSHHLLGWIIAGFGIGVLVMLGVRWLNRRAEVKEEQEKRWPVGLLAGAAVDQIVSGILLGVGIAAGAHVGALLSFSMAVEDLSFGLAVATTLGRVGASRPQTIGVTTALGLLFVLVTVAGAILLGGLPRAIIVLLLSFGSAALLYVVTEQLLVEAHDVKKAQHLATAFFAGFLLIMVLGKLSGN